jgi:hypothetical protein
VYEGCPAVLLRGEIRTFQMIQYDKMRETRLDPALKNDAKGRERAAEITYLWRSFRS